MAALPGRRCCLRFLLLGSGVRGAPRHPSCRLSTNSKPKGLFSAFFAKAKYVNMMYKQFVERRFPRFYLLYSTFMKGFRMLLADGKEMRRIRKKMVQEELALHELPYREMETVRQFRRDIIKAAPIVVISIPPFANYLVLLLMYFFPRQVLIRHFWTPAQQIEFLEVYHKIRIQAYPEILNGLLQAIPHAPEKKVQEQMQLLLTKIQDGSHPEVSHLQMVTPAFSQPPLSMEQLPTPQMRALSRLMFLTPYFPSFILRRRLRTHIYELHHLDVALLRMGVKNLTDEEVKNACYVRGLNSTDLDPAECRTWLSQWLQLSKRLKESEASLLLHSMVLLSTNYLYHTSGGNPGSVDTAALAKKPR